MASRTPGKRLWKKGLRGCSRSCRMLKAVLRESPRGLRRRVVLSSFYHAGSRHGVGGSAIAGHGPAKLGGAGFATFEFDGNGVHGIIMDSDGQAISRIIYHVEFNVARIGPRR